MVAATSSHNVGNCMDHSGITTRMNIGIALLTLLCGLFGYSSFIQLPALENRITEKITAIERTVDGLQRDVVSLKLEDIRIKSQRNSDHPQKDAFQ